MEIIIQEITGGIIGLGVIILVIVCVLAWKTMYYTRVLNEGISSLS